MSQPEGQNQDAFRQDDDLIETDSDDSDFVGGSDQSDVSVDDDDIGSEDDSDDDSNDGGSRSKSGSVAGPKAGDDADDDDHDDDSDYEEEDESDDDDGDDEDANNDKDEQGDDSASSDGSVDVGAAPFTGYIFPAIHKMVAAGQVEEATGYLEEMFNPEQAGPQVWEVSDSLGRNAVHLALLHNDLEMLRVLLDMDVRLLNAKYGMDNEDRWKFSAIRRKFDDMSVLHLALCRGPWDETRAIDLLNLLYSHPAIGSVAVTDYWKRTPLHIAVMTGQANLVRYLVARAPEWLLAVDALGQLPIHFAIDSKNGSLTQLLLTLSFEVDSVLFQSTRAQLAPERHLITHCVAKCSWECMVLVCRFLNEPLPAKAMEIADRMGVEIGGLSEVMQNLEAAQKCVMDKARETTLVYDLDCLGHVRLAEESEDGHQRLKRIKMVVENPNRLEVLVGAHGSLKTSEFANLRTVESVAPCPLADVVRVHDWAYVQRVIKVAESAPVGSMVRLDKGDTNVTSESWAAALKASGAVVQAMDLVCSEASKSAFVAVRPPGHHVSSRGAVDPNMEDDDTGSNGFCLLNNVAIGAAYALCVHRHVIGKVAIIDFDIHHGNGTEAIVRGLRQPKTIQIPLNFTGLTGNLEMHAYHPWLDRNDADNVFFASVHRFDGRFYPQSGQTQIDSNIVNAGLESFSTSQDFRRAFSRLVLPQLAAFAPDLVMISAGFDGHVRDRLASGEWDISEDDYYWVTEQLVAIANTYSSGRIVSVLEGGYNTKGGWLSPLAQCVGAHVRALSSSWACKYVPPSGDSSDEESNESVDDSEAEEVGIESAAVVEGITDLLARADAVLNDDVSPANKRARIDDSSEFSQLFGDQ